MLDLGGKLGRRAALDVPLLASGAAAHAVSFVVSPRGAGFFSPTSVTNFAALHGAVLPGGPLKRISGRRELFSG
ncbi:hypothetical protein ACP3WT_26250, partial [Salmonella enterica]|uniref:hypothetical protein n=1 Tax=Salmonella enterica TaxID=28901 RepID=UPI003CF436D3